MSVFYRDWRTIEGVQIPMTIETRAEAGSAVERMAIENVTLNPSLSDSHFQRYGLEMNDLPSNGAVQMNYPVGWLHIP